MPKNPAPPKSGQPKPTPQYLLNMSSDLFRLRNDAQSIAAVTRHNLVLPEHFLCAVLKLAKFQPPLDDFFQDFATTSEALLLVIKQHLAEEAASIPYSPNAPTYSDEFETIFTSVDEWISGERKGYCLPFICLLELLGPAQDTFGAKLLNHLGIEASDVMAEIAFLENKGLKNLSARHPALRSPDERRFLQQQRQLLCLTAFATRFTIDHRQRYLLPEHLLLGFLTVPRFQKFLHGLPTAIDQAALKALPKHLSTFLLDNVEKLQDSQTPSTTPAFYRVTSKVLNLVETKKDMNNFPALFLLAILEVDTELAKLLKGLGFRKRELTRMARMTPVPPPTKHQPHADRQEIERRAEHAADELPQLAQGEPFGDDDDDVKPLFGDDDDFPGGDIFSESDLETYSVELVEQALQGKIDPLIGRQQELDRLVEILHKKRSSNAMIIGNEGVGKTAVVEGLALRIARKNVPDTLLDAKIYALNLGAMIAGAEYRGVFEQRLTNCIKEIAAQPKGFLFIDEIHTMLGAGTGGHDGTLDASNILKPYLARGEIRCIGATTYDEYQKRILSDRAFARRFMRISLAEPSRDETLQILQGLVGTYEEFHHVRFSPDILEYIVELSGRYVHEKYFPDKAIEVMDECGAHYRSGLAQGTEVTREDVERVVCRVANLPAITVQTDDREKLRGLAERLQAKIFGQDEAIGELVRRVKVAKAGFQDARRPLLTAFLCGSSGCGKTELARQLAAELGIAFVKLDMSEYSEEYAASRLIGSAPGYVGYDRPGALTEPVIQNPHCLLLLDEIEKAHAAVFNLLLQVLDEGRLTDNKGREASFRNAIILMTSNAGSRASAEAINLLGFSKSDADQAQNRQDIIQRVMKKTFPPEFRNRIQLTVMMNDLTRQALESIVRKSLATANRQLAEQKVTITLTPTAVAQIAQRAEDEHLGGRPVERLVDQVVKQHIVDELLFGKLAHGGTVAIDYRDGEFQYLYGE